MVTISPLHSSAWEYTRGKGRHVIFVRLAGFEIHRFWSWRPGRNRDYDTHMFENWYLLMKSKNTRQSFRASRECGFGTGPFQAFWFSEQPPRKIYNKLCCTKSIQRKLFAASTCTQITRWILKPYCSQAQTELPAKTRATSCAPRDKMAKTSLHRTAGLCRPQTAKYEIL